VGAVGGDGEPVGFLVDVAAAGGGDGAAALAEVDEHLGGLAGDGHAVLGGHGAGAVDADDLAEDGLGDLPVDVGGGDEGGRVLVGLVAEHGLAVGVLEQEHDAPVGLGGVIVVLQVPGVLVVAHPPLVAVAAAGVVPVGGGEAE